MNIVLFETVDKQKYNAGSKARLDALQIAVAKGYRHIPLFRNCNSKLLVVAHMVLACCQTLILARKGDEVLIQYPYNPNLVNHILIGILGFGKKLKGYTVCVLIHDMMSLRSEAWFKSRNIKLLRSELRLFRPVDEIICHNDRMRKLCKQAWPQGNYTTLGVFDYLYEGEVPRRNYAKPPTVVIAGYLGNDKSGYLYNGLQNVEGLKFELFGANYDGEETENIHYHGKFEPEELIEILDGQFGLVWDGDACETCTGATGEYLRWNNPHKFSLYIAAYLPVIVWSESAIADFVKEQGIGICVDSIFDVYDVINKLSVPTYQQMLESVLTVRERIIQGGYLGDILKK